MVMSSGASLDSIAKSLARLVEIIEEKFVESEDSDKE